MLADANSSVTAIHVHGACGNMFSAGYMETLARNCLTSNVNFLTINTSGHDCISEGVFRGENYGYFGGAISPFEYCVQDIAGAVALAGSFSEKLVLIGHSLGCDRITYYARETGDLCPLVLISPCDSYRLHQNFLGEEKVHDQIARLKRVAVEDPFALLSKEEYGINNRGERYRIPVTRDTFLSIANGPPFVQFRLDIPPPFHLANRCLACIGGKDSLQTATPRQMFARISELFGECDHFLSATGDHEFAGGETELAEKLVSWILH
jgi:hypothetical protein